MEKIERSAKTVDEAIEDALRFLHVTLDEVDVEILEEGAKGFLGFGAKPATVLVKKKFNPEEIVTQFLREVMTSMMMLVDIETTFENNHLDINLIGEDMGLIIGKRGQTLDALQHIVSLVVNKGDAPYISILVDTENYRKRRKDTLESLAKNLARKVKQTKKPVVLEPMSPYERRIIHSTLQHDKQIKTHSEGQEPYRYVVVSLNRN